MFGDALQMSFITLQPFLLKFLFILALLILLASDVVDPLARHTGTNCKGELSLYGRIIKSDFHFQAVSRHSFGPEFCVFWPRKMPASEWGSLWESSSFVPWFPTFVIRNVPGTVSECALICWFRRNSSNLDRAPKMRDSVWLNSWDSFLLTLPSISSESCVIYSSLILGTDVFRDWPFLGFSSCVSLVTAANFRLLLNVAIFEGKMLLSYEDWIGFYLLISLRI